TIARANGYRGMLYVEVPTFNWIVKKNAFWDIFYEHCNYFTEESMEAMFDGCITGNFFGGQYMYLWADLSRLRPSIPAGIPITSREGLIFRDQVDHYYKLLRNGKSFAIWGAGAKGSTFLNLLDKKKEYVKYVIDINPAKQNRYVAGTGHPILPPEILEVDPVENIIVMNENYFDEIKTTLNGHSIQLTHL
ncbi:MAG TPA: hypothetical protein VGR89_09680, partial [Puia sp.]|nr:hypothetical protein [Puia sp.]